MYIYISSPLLFITCGFWRAPVKTIQKINRTRTSLWTVYRALEKARSRCTKKRRAEFFDRSVYTVAYIFHVYVHFIIRRVVKAKKFWVGRAGIVALFMEYVLRSFPYRRNTEMKTRVFGAEHKSAFETRGPRTCTRRRTIVSNGRHMGKISKKTTARLPSITSSIGYRCAARKLGYVTFTPNLV